MNKYIAVITLFVLSSLLFFVTALSAFGLMRAIWGNDAGNLSFGSYRHSIFFHLSIFFTTTYLILSSRFSLRMDVIVYYAAAFVIFGIISGLGGAQLELRKPFLSILALSIMQAAFDLGAVSTGIAFAFAVLSPSKPVTVEVIHNSKPTEPLDAATGRTVTDHGRQLLGFLARNRGFTMVVAAALGLGPLARQSTLLRRNVVMIDGRLALGTSFFSARYGSRKSVTSQKKLRVDTCKKKSDASGSSERLRPLPL